jgi:hypothetical protein
MSDNLEWNIFLLLNDVRSFCHRAGIDFKAYIKSHQFLNSYSHRLDVIMGKKTRYRFKPENIVFRKTGDLWCVITA